MTNWTKVEDENTDYVSANDSLLILTEAGEPIATEAGEYITYEGVSTDYSEVADSLDRYIPFGVGLKVATEAFDWILTEGRQTLLVHSKTNWTEVDDVSTSYTKVEDA